jgi:hypothetical protein
MSVSPPDGMNNATWDYVLQFTLAHEVPVYHMYNNKQSADAAQDVTCGIGVRLDTRETAVNDPAIKALFFNKTTGHSAGDDELRQDWDTASQILRRTASPETEYAARCQLVMDKDKTWDYLQVRLKAQLAADRTPGRCKCLDGFKDFPAVAQAAVACFCYGWSLTRAPHLSLYLEHWDFDSAQKACWLDKASLEKLYGLRVLFYNAGRVYEQNLNYDWLPGNTYRPPLVLQWQETREWDFGAGAYAPRARPDAPDRKKYDPTQY